MPTTGIGEVAKYLDDIFRSPGDALEENLEKRDRMEQAKRQMREAVTAQLSFGNLPLLLSTRSYVQPDGNYMVQVQVDIPNSALAATLPEARKDTETSRLDIYCALIDLKSRVVDEFVDSIDVSRRMLSSLPTEDLHYLNLFAAPAGSYTLKAAIRASDNKRLGMKEQAVSAAPADRSAVSLSEVLITNRIQASGGQGPTPSDSGLTLGDTRLLPNPARQFLPSDSLFLYFQAYLPQGRELKDTDLSVAIHFMKDNAVVNRLEPRKITDTQSMIPGVVNFATTLPLNGFAPGEYTLQVQAIDHTARKFAFQRTSFAVVDR
jgi:hypothetical protein